MGFAKPTYGSGTEFKNPWALSKDVTTLPPMRILPPFTEGSGWGSYEKTHFGYKGTDPTNPKGKMKAFACIEEKGRDGIITASCPECKKIDEQEELLKDRESAERQVRRAKGMDEAQIEAELTILLAPLKEWTVAHNLDKKQFYKAKNETGEFNYLKVPYTVHKEISKILKELLASEGIDGVSGSQGCWFVISRTGKGLQTEYAVAVKKENQEHNGRIFSATKLAPLTEEDFQAAVKEFEGRSASSRKLTREQVLMLVNGSGEPEEVDAIFAMSQQSKPSAERSPRAALPPAQTMAPPPGAVPAPAPMSQPTSTPAPAPVDLAAQMAAQIAALQAQLAAQVAAQANATNVAPPPAAAAPVGAGPAFNPLNPNTGNEEWLRQIQSNFPPKL